VAQAPVQPTPTEISLREARELVAQRYLSPTRAGELLVGWLDAKLVRWRYEDVKNNSGVPTKVALNGFWRPVGLSINWEESWAARKVEPRRVARGGMAPGGIVWMSHGRPTQPSSQLGSSYNFFVYGIRLAREDIELQLGGYDEPASVADPAPPSASVPEPLMSPKDWFAGHARTTPGRKGKLQWPTRSACTSG
jgi:hypothetical protein